MSNYKLNAIYKQKLRCKLRNSNRYKRNTCLCCHCWVENKLQLPVLKIPTNSKKIPVPHYYCHEFDNKFEKIENYKMNEPLPPPLPAVAPSNISKLQKFSANYKTESVIDEIKRVWKTREFCVCGEDVPSEFALTTLDSVLQEGPNCGLAALAMAATATPRKLTMDELFLEAKSQGYTHQGEMFSAVNMALLAKSVVMPWFNVELLTDGLFCNYDKILRSLFEGALLLVPYDAAGNYAPCCKSGHKSHWAVVCGVAKVKGSGPDCYVFARQGKSRYLALWSYQELVVSNNNLTEFDPKRASDGSEYILPKGGVEAGLAGKAVLLHMIHKGPDFTSFIDLN